jgi:hypothetical protein
MVGRLADDGRPLDIKALGIGEERVGVELGHLEHALVALGCGLDHLVLARIVVAGKVADVGDVHHVLHLVAEVAQGPRDDIVEDVGAEVAYVRVVIDGRATAVEADGARGDRFECLQGSSERVVES